MTLLDKYYLFLYFPISLLLYWKLLRHPRLKLIFLTGISFAFYSLLGVKIVAVMLSLSLGTYALGRMGRHGWGVALNLAALGLFKYWDFGVAQLARFGLSELLPILNLGVPLGLSYYVFKHVGYLLYLQKERYEPSGDWLAFITFTAFLPQITAGPISSYNDTGEQLRNLPNKLTDEYAYLGLTHLAAGLAKKLLLADQMVIIFNQGIYDYRDGFLAIWVYILLRTVHLYLDFSGYTDTMLGVGYLFGVSLPPNFDNPFLAPSPAKFWERWHISLSRWFRIYVFTPLSRWMMRRWGSGRRELIQYSANTITMLLVGLWHGASYGFIIWGVYMSMLINLHVWLSRRKEAWAAAWGYRTVFMVLIFGGIVAFGSTGVGSLLLNLQDMVGMYGWGDLAYLEQIPLKSTLTLAVGVLFSFSGVSEAKNLAASRSKAVALVLGIILMVTLAAMGAPGDFTYAQF